MFCLGTQAVAATSRPAKPLPAEVAALSASAKPANIFSVNPSRETVSSNVPAALMRSRTSIFTAAARRAGAWPRYHKDEAMQARLAPFESVMEAGCRAVDQLIRLSEV